MSPYRCKSHEARQRSIRIQKQEAKREQRKTRYDNEEQAALQKLRTSKRWGRLRKFFLANNPLCQDPFGVHEREGVTTPVEEIHHIKPAGKHPHLFFAENNLAGLCRACHRRIEGRDLLEQLTLLGRLDSTKEEDPKD